MREVDLTWCVVAYKGGGFNGCWWQWNYFAFDGDGEWFNVYSSGYKGITAPDQFDHTIHFDENDNPYFLIRKERCHLYKVDVTEDSLAFADAYNPGHVAAVAAVMEKRGIVMRGECDECGEVFDIRSMDPTNWAGDGHGIQLEANSLVCRACYMRRDE
jgi:hypothetical protein